MTVREPQRNVIIMNGDKLYITNCRESVVDQSTGEIVWTPSSNPDETLILSCTYVRNGSLDGQLSASDCINAVLVNTSLVLRENFTLAQLMSAYQHPNASRRLPASGNHLIPTENELIIYNRSKLLVNLEVLKMLHFLS